MKVYCSVVVAMTLAATASSAATVDVDNLLVGDPSAGGYLQGALSANVPPGSQTTKSAYQTWTVGKTGTLAQIDLFSLVGAAISTGPGQPYTSPVPLDFDVTLTVLGGGSTYAPGNLVLGSVTKSANDIVQNGVTAFDFSVFNIFATSGTNLTFQMSVDDCPAYCSRSWASMFEFFAGGTTDGYGEGAAFFRENGVLYNFSQHDLNFRTWMTSVPEPATWGLMITGFIGVGGTLRRRRTVLA